MVISKSWAAAFINSVEKSGGEIEDAYITLKAIANCAAKCAVSLKAVFHGSSAAGKLEPLLRKAFSALANGAPLSSGQETAIRFYLLMVKKNKARHIGSVIGDIKNILDNERGVITVWLEYAFPLAEEYESLIRETIRKRKGAALVKLRGHANPELIGGYTLRIGDEIVDASIRCQLRRMETWLADCDGEKKW